MRWKSFERGADMLLSTRISPSSMRGNTNPIGISSLVMCTNTISPKWELSLSSWWTKRLNGSSHAWKMNFGHHTHAEAVAALRYVRVWTSGSDVNPNQYIFYPFSCMLTNGWLVVGVVPGAQPMHGDLGIARRHDPVALPPRNVLEWCRNCISMRLKLDCLPLYFVFHHF